MVALILGMLLCVGLALAVVALVAVPARREGRELLSPQGEEIVAAVKDRTDRTDRTEPTSDQAGDGPTTSADQVGEPAPRSSPTAPVTTAAPAEQRRRQGIWRTQGLGPCERLMTDVMGRSSSCH